MLRQNSVIKMPGRNLAIWSMVMRSSFPALTSTGFFWSCSKALAILIAGSMFFWADWADWAKCAAAAAAMAAADWASVPTWGVACAEEFSWSRTDGEKVRNTLSAMLWRFGRHFLNSCIVSSDMTGWELCCDGGVWYCCGTGRGRCRSVCWIGGRSWSSFDESQSL